MVICTGESNDLTSSSCFSFIPLWSSDGVQMVQNKQIFYQATEDVKIEGKL